MHSQNGAAARACPPARDQAFERGLLAEGQKWAGLGSLAWDAQVLARLEAMNARYGDRWISLPVNTLVHELRREGEDLGGWGVLLAQHPAVAAMSDGQRVQILLRLQAIASLGARVEHELRQLEQLLLE